jgi:hypothetical protein
MSEGAVPEAVGDPAAEYTDRLARAESDANHWNAREKRLSQARLAIFVVGLAVGWFAFGTKTLAGAAILPPIAIFIVLLIVHDRTIGRRDRAERTVHHFAWGLARIEDRWSGQGETGERYAEDSHPYADDLDLFGDGSLFQLLCTARTPAGERTLADWLKTQADAEEVRRRQRAVAELRDKLDLRRDLALIGADVRSRLNPESLTEWGSRPAELFAIWVRPVATALTAASLLCLAAWIWTSAGAIPFVFAIAAQSVFALALRKRVKPIVAAVTSPTRDLALLKGLLERLETEPFESPLLVELRSALDTDGHPPSQRIAQLQRYADLLDARANQFFAPIGALLLWGTQLAVAVEGWRARCGPELDAWLDAAGTIEALAALSAYAYEHPDDPFPEIVNDGPEFDGRALGHPLLSREACVRNDLRLDNDPQAFMMSGSNMSGKSTMLRTVGCNAVLALAGATVRADALRISSLTVAASIRVSDSLQTGTSHFYAEIKRLRQVVELSDGSPPALFLLDEILHGTNSHDRRIGAAAVIRGLLQRGAIGIITTHDLALAEIADELAPRMHNVHFADHLEGGEMAFDYRLQPGVVTKSNAIELMRSVGLEV